MKIRSQFLVLGAAAVVGLAGVVTGAGATSSAPPTWKVYNYNPSGRALAPVSPASNDGKTVTFNFAPGTYTALLTTMDNSINGDLTGKTITDTVSVTGATVPFTTQNGGGCGNPPAVRLYFTSPCFAYTNFWWSNPVHFDLANGPFAFTVSLADPSQWSDWNGHMGSAELTGFADAVSKVNQVGLSFGGDCFFENGATGTGTFSSAFSVS